MRGLSVAGARVNSIKVAAVLFLATGLAQVLSIPSTVAYIARNREHPLVFPGVRGLAEPFDALGIEAVVALGWLFVALGAVKLLVAVLTWRSRKLGGVLASVLFLPGLFFWIGFGLPGWLGGGPHTTGTRRSRLDDAPLIEPDVGSS